MLGQRVKGGKSTLTTSSKYPNHQGPRFKVTFFTTDTEAHHYRSINHGHGHGHETYPSQRDAGC